MNNYIYKIYIFMNIKKKEKQNVIQINISFPKHYNKYFLFLHLMINLT